MFVNSYPEQEEKIEKYATMIHSAHKSVQFEAPIQQVVDSGLVPKLLEIMASESEQEFLIESSWCILNICSREEDKFTKCIVDLGGLDILMNLFDSQAQGVVSNAVWVMSNIVGSGSEFRDMCLEKDCTQKFLKLLERFPNSLRLIDHILRGLSNLCHQKPSPKWNKVLPALPVFHQHISVVHSPEALNRALWAILCISGILESLTISKQTFVEQNAQEVIDQGCVPFLITHLYSEDPGIISPAIRTFGNLLSGDEEQVDEILRHTGFLPRAFELAKHKNKQIKKETFWAISNITAGSHKQIEKIIENDDYLAILINAAMTEFQDVLREVTFVICNLFRVASPQQIQRVVCKHGIFESFSVPLDNLDDMKENVLEAILTVLQVGEDGGLETDYIKEMEEASLIEIVKELANNDEFGSTAKKILKYFVTENEREIENS